MKKIILGLILGLISFFQVSATHFAGGDCYYDYISATPGDNTRARYAIHYIFYRDIQGNQFLSTSITVGMYDASPTSVSGVVEVLRSVPQYSRQILNQYSPGCFYRNPIGYERVEFIDTIDLLRTRGFFFSTSNYARNGQQIQNLNQNGPFSIVLSTYIPPAISFVNSSPRFRAIPVPYNCVGKKYVYNHDGFDPDGDSLVFTIVWPYGQGGTYRAGGNVGEGGIPDFNVTTLPLAQRVHFPTRPPLPGNNTGVSGYYTPVTYQGAYSFPSNQVPAIAPDTLKMSGNTGEISFTPINQGGFVVAVECAEYRVDRINNTVTYLGSSRRDLQFFFDANCSQNNSPEIFVTDSFTLKVGDTLNFDAYGIDYDPTRDTVIMGISGDIIGTGPGKATVTITPGLSQTLMNVRWIPSCANARTAPYFLIISAKDSLCAVTQKTVYIKVLPKDIVRPVRNLTITKVFNGFELNWVNSSTKDFKMYRIFRSIDQNPFVEIDSIVQGSTNYYSDLNVSTIFDSVRYYLVGENTCNELGANSEIIKYLNRLPISFLPDTIRQCGQSVLLDAGNPGSNYFWNTGETSQKINAYRTGWYKVNISSPLFSTSLSDSVYVDLLSVDLGNDTSICAGQTYLINPFVQGNPNLKNGLMAAYSFDGNAYDFSGNGNHGKPKGVTPTTDRFGNPNGAYFFRGFGNNDHVFVPNHPSMHIDSVYTMSLWYQEIPGNAMNGVGAYSPTNGTAALFAKEGDGIGTPPGFFADLNYNANGGYSLNYLQVDGCCGVRSKFQTQFSHPMQVDSTWKHLVIVNTKDYAETYINGVKVKFASMPSTFLAANRNNLYFGTYGYGKQSPFWYPFYGSMDEVMMYNRALDSNEIQTLYQLQNSQNAYSYTWSTGATTPFIGVTPSQTTTYYCTISNGVTTCTDSITIVVKPNPPVVSLPDTLFQCGNPGRLDAGNPGATYTWSNKATTQSILPVNGGWYSVVVNQNGCTATDSSYVDLLTLDLGRDTGICIGSSITLSVQGQNLGNTTPDSIFVPSDASWKVSVLNPEGWEYVGFNDTNSFWPSAKIQGTSSISGAQPIWHPDSVGIYDAYFRKVFEVNGQPNPDFQLEIAAENEYYAFVNGRFVGYGNSSMGGKQTYPIAQHLVQGYNSVAIFASNWGASTAQLTALLTGTTDKKAYLWTTGDTTSSITVSPTQTTTYYCTVTNGYTFCTDSIVVRVGTPQSTSVSAATCANQPYAFGGRMISQPGVYVDSLRTSLGCDSVVTLSLNVNPISVDSISAKVCGNTPYIFGGNPLTQAGIYIDTLQTTLGCDSMVVLNLQFAQPDTQRITAAICNGSSYMFNGQNLTQGGNYQARFINAQGCDSVILLSLQVNSNPTTIVNDTICRGQVYSFGGQNYSNSGQYSFVTVNSSGCTSTVILNLVVNEIQKATIVSNGSLEFCRNTGVTLFASAGTSYLWSTGSRNSSIQVFQSQPIWVEVTDQNGCISRSDSMFTLQRISVPNRSDSIFGFLNPCGVRGTTNTLTYSVDRDPNATSYTWVLTDGITAVGKSDSNVIQVRYPAGYTTGQIRVIPNNACGSGVARAIYPRTGQPNTVPVVTQSVTSVCGIRGTGTSATYTIQPVDGCNSYLWTLPSNCTIVSGQGTTSIQVVFGSTYTGGVISVVGVSPCGNSPQRSITVSLLAKPIISGPNTLCPGDVGTYTVPFVPNASRYRFNLPAGLVLVSQNANSAVIRNNGSFISGSIGAQVQTTTCGWSQPGSFSVNTSACKSTSEAFSMSFYPNPTPGELQLQFGNSMKQIQVSIFGSDGRLVKRDVLGSISNQVLNYRGLAEGLYHLEVLATDAENNVHRRVEKLIIQR